MRHMALGLLAMSLFWAPAALPCTGPATFGDVNLGKDGVLAHAPLWVEIASADVSVEVYPVIVTNKTSNQPILFEIAHSQLHHLDNGAAPSRYYKLVPEMGTWGAVGDKLELSVDNSTAHFIEPLQLPEVEIVAGGLSLSEEVFVPPMFWSDQIEMEETLPNTCWPDGGWKITIPFMVYETLVPWGYLLVYTDNQENPVRMIATEVQHFNAGNAEVLNAWVEEDPGRCIRVVPMNLDDETFAEVEYCLPTTEGSDAGVSGALNDGGAIRDAEDAGVLGGWADSGAGTNALDSGPASWPGLLDAGGRDSTGILSIDAGAGGTSGAPDADGCNCSQAPRTKTANGATLLGLLGIIFWVRRRD